LFVAILFSEAQVYQQGGYAALAADASREEFPPGMPPDGSTEGAGSFATSSTGMEALIPSTSPTRMAKSVTRHVQNPPAETFQFLLCGIDTLDLGLFVTWDANWKRTKTFLDEKKQASQGTTGLIDRSDIGREFLHLPSGKPPNYRYQLLFPEYRLYIAISDKPGKSPNVYVSLLAETLWHVNITTILELLEFDLDNIGGTIERVQPSRLDLCADFKVNPLPTYLFIQEHRVSRSHKNRPYLDGDTLETYYCGSGTSPVQVRIYDKGKEIRKSKKQWFLPIWGIDDPDGVWRVEFQLRRAFLHQYRINKLDDLWQKLESIWNYLTDEWFSLRLPDNEKTERRTVHPWWKAVQECRGRFGDGIDARRNYSSDTVEPIQRTLSHIMGRIISIAALNGIKDREAAIQNVTDLLSKHMDDRKFEEEYQKKSIKLGYRGTLGGSDYEPC
jgi:hypothetical protein